MDIHLALRKPPPRGLIKDLSEFKPTPSSKKGKPSKTSKKTDKANANDASQAESQSKEVSCFAEFLAAVDLSAEDFLEDYTYTYKFLEGLRTTLKGPAFTREHRLSKRLGTRILAMCAIQLNLDSQNRPRDWPVAIAAVTLESALIGHYREHLLKQCIGAQALRSSLNALFSGITLPFSSRDADKNVVSVRTWEFADKIPVQDGVMGQKIYDLEELTNSWDGARAGHAQDKKDTILGVVQYLERQKYLACSDPNAKTGTVETIAHHHISALAEVCAALYVLSGLIDIPQIMYKNKALRELEDDADFDMASVDIPSIPRRPHAASTDYLTEVSLRSLGR